MTYDLYGPACSYKKALKKSPRKGCAQILKQGLREPDGFTNGTATCGRNEERKKDK